MIKFHGWLQKYLLCAFPLVAVLILWRDQPPGDTALSIVYNLMAFHLLFWFAALFVFAFLLLVSAAAREKTLLRLANIKERDEREEQITGRAARYAYISTLGLLVFLLIGSIVTFNIALLPPEQQVDGNTRSISVGASFHAFEQHASDDETAVAYNGLPLSTGGVLLLVLIWQLSSFALAARGK